MFRQVIEDTLICNEQFFCHLSFHHFEVSHFNAMQLFSLFPKVTPVIRLYKKQVSDWSHVIRTSFFRFNEFYTQQYPVVVSLNSIFSRGCELLHRGAKIEWSEFHISIDCSQFQTIV